MKKTYAFLTLLAALAVAAPGVQAQDEVTVADGTETNMYVPVYGTFIDAAQHNQIIYPASMLGDMDGMLVSSITFYLNEPASNTWAGTEYTVSIGTVADTAISSYSYVVAQDLTEVWSGELSNANEVVVFDFDSPFLYTGGNLLVDITSTQQYNIITTYGNGYFVGTSTSHYASAYGYTDSGTSPSSPNSRQLFLPKASFAISPADGDICFKPKNVTVSDITADGATVSWTDTNNTGATYTLGVVHDGDTTLYNNISGTSYTLTGLVSNSVYTIIVRSECSAESHSGWTGVSMRTDCSETMGLPYYTDFTDDYVSGVWVPFCWYQVRTAQYTTSNGTVYTQPLVWGSAGISGNDNALGFIHQNASDTGMICTSVLPEGDLQISFWVDVTTGTAQVGFISDTADLSTFSPVLTIEAGSGYRQYDIYTANHPEAEGARLAFYADGLTRAFMDNFSVKLSNGCHRPLTSEVIASTYNTITVGWDDPEGEAWQVSYSTTPSDTADNSNAATVAATESTVVLTGLEPGTTYYVWVRTVCGNSSSEWRECGSATTDLSCYAVTDLEVNNITGTSAVATWAYAGNGRGIAESGAYVTLTNNTDNTTTTWTVTGPYAFLTGLQSNHSYTVSVSTLCDPDSATATTTSFAIGGCGTTELGTSTSYYYPTNGYFNYSYFQSIYNSSLVNGMDTIYGIAIRQSSGNATRTIDVYVEATSLSQLTAAVPVTTATRVFSGSVTFDASEDWDTITFDTPFVNDGSGNLLITIDDNTGSYTTDYPYYYYHQNTGYSYYYYSDGTNVDPASPGSTPYSTTSQPDMRFVGQCMNNNDCPKPNIAVDAIDETSATLVWIAGGDESSWSVQYRTDDSTSTWVTAGTATDTTYTVTGLSPRTHYFFRVSYTCGNADVASPTVDAYTGCSTLNELPFTEDFENSPTGSDPLCWQFFSTSTSTSHYVTTTGHGEGHGMYIYPYGDTYLVSPAMPAGTDPTQLEISWWAIYGGTTNNYDMGLMTDPTNPATFRRLFHTSGNSSNWTEYTAYADTVTIGPSETIYVAFRSVSTTSTIRIDDVNIAIASCRRLTDVHVTTLTDTSATVAWTGDEDVTFEYCLTTTDTIPANVELHTTAETSISFEGLLPNTQYYIWVRTICEDGPSQWSAESTFRTNCAAAQPTPWFEDFNSWGLTFNDCWQRFSGDFDTVPTLTSTTSGWNPNTTYGNVNISGTALCENLYSTNKYWAVTPAMAISGDLALSFDMGVAAWSSATPNFDNDDRFIVAVSADGGTTWAPIYQMGSDPTRDDMSLNDLGNDYTNIIAPISGYNGQVVRIAFVAQSTAYGGDNRVVIDNISLHSMACAHPVNIAVNYTAESADFSWQDISTDNEEGYILVIDTVNNVESAAMTFSTTDTFYTVSGLTPTTTYYWFLRSACEETPTAASWARGQFRTACLPQDLPLDFDFEGMPTGSGTTPDCWTLLSSSDYSGTVYPYVYNYGTPHGKVVYFYGYNYNSTGLMTLATPLAAAPLNNLEISFTYYRSSGDMDVYLAPNLSDTSSWVLLTTLNSGYTWADYEFATDTVTTLTDTGYVVFQGRYGYTYTSGYLDDLHISTINPCRKVSNLEVSDIDATTATVSWTAIGEASQWLVYVDDQYVGTADSTTYSLTGLSSSETHTVGVRTYCGVGDTARLVSTRFRTLCGQITAVPYEQDFNNTTASLYNEIGELPGCWYALYDVDIAGTPAEAHVATGGSSSYQYSPDNTNSLFIRASSNSSTYAANCVLALPELDAPVNTLTISFWYRHESEEYGILSVGYLTGSAFSDFVEVESFDPVSDSGATVTVNMAEAPATATHIALRWSNSYSTWYSVCIDNVSVVSSSEMPHDECLTPSNLATVNVDSTVATINWTTGGNETQWQLMLNDESETLRNVSSKPYTLSGLTPSTTYTVKVRAKCDANNFSDWSSALTFTTTSGDTVPTDGIERAAEAVFTLYPNPATSNVTVSASAPATVCLLDLSGRTVYCNDTPAQVHTINVGTLAKGIYYVRVTDNNGSAVRKLVVE